MRLRQEIMVVISSLDTNEQLPYIYIYISRYHKIIGCPTIVYLYHLTNYLTVYSHSTFLYRLPTGI
jgi:hypothetical protein